jgi:hypothetical protein
LVRDGAAIVLDVGVVVEDPVVRFLCAETIALTVLVVGSAV